MPDAGVIIQVLFLPLAGVLWWFFRKVITDHDNLEKAVHANAAEIARAAADNAASNARAIADNAAISGKSLADYKLHVAETFVTKNDLSEVIKTFNRSVDAIFTKLDKIENKLDNKADK